MKKINIVLVVAFVSLCTTSCQKECSMDSPSERTEQIQLASSHHVTYWIDDVRYSVTLQTDDAVSDLFRRLTELAILGHHIRTSNDDIAPSASLAKDVIEFHTSNQEDMRFILRSPAHRMVRRCAGA